MGKNTAESVELEIDLEEIQQRLESIIVNGHDSAEVVRNLTEVISLIAEIADTD